MKDKYKKSIWFTLGIITLISILPFTLHENSFKQINCEQIVLDNPNSHVICDNFPDSFSTDLLFIILLGILIVGIIGIPLVLIYKLVYKYKKRNINNLE